jgi:PST family polysaccharide transporter
VVSITLIINGYTTVSTALLERDLHYRKLAIINVTSYAVGFGLLGSSLALLGVGAWAIIGATLSQNLTRAIMLRAMSTASVRWAISASDVKHLLVFGGGVTTGKLGAYAAIGAAGLGLYNMAFTIMDLPRRFLGSVIDRVGFAAMTRVQDDGIRLRAGYLQSLELANVTLLPLTVFLIIAAPEVVRVLLGTRWDAAVVPLQVLLTTVPLRASFRLACQLGTAVGRVYRIAALQYLYTAIIGVAALIGLQGGLVGVAAGVTVGVIGMWVIMTPVALRIVGASLRDYLAAWIPGCLVGAAVMVATGVAVSITRQNIESEIVRLALVSGFTALMVLVLLWTWPRAMGRTALRVVLDLGQGIPVLAAVTARLETSRVPDTQAGIADSVR